MEIIELKKRYPGIPEETVTEIFQRGYLEGWNNNELRKVRKRKKEMRLIEEEALLINIVKAAPDLRRLSTKTIGEAIDRTPTVNAIPFDWLFIYLCEHGAKVTLKQAMVDWGRKTHNETRD